MARIKLQIPLNLPFECKLPIRITDLNFGNHLGNDRLLAMMGEARAQFFAYHGFAELDADGAAFIMGDCAIQFKSEGFYGQILRCEIGAGDYTRTAFDLYYRFVIEGDEKILALAKTGLVCFDYDRQRVCAFPDSVKEKFGDVFQTISGEGEKVK